MRGLSDFNKTAIFKCYVLMKDYLHDEDMEQEECFAQMCTMIEMQRVAIPDTIERTGAYYTAECRERRTTFRSYRPL